MKSGDIIKTEEIELQNKKNITMLGEKENETSLE